MTDRTKLLGLSGSIRRDSFCTAILRTAAEQIADRADLTLFPLETVPHYNQDLDNADAPASARALQHAIAAAAGLVIISPEYNYGMSGVLKNALEWASRPYGRSNLIGKPVLTMTASPASTGGVRAQVQLSETLLANSARVLFRPQIVIGLVHEKVKENRLVDPGTLQFIAAGLDDLLGAIATV